MTASHPRLTAVSAIFAVVLLSALSACGPSRNSASSTTASCNPGQTCSTSTVSFDGTSLSVSAGTASGSQTLSAQLVSGQLHCPTSRESLGAMAIFSSTASDASKVVTYTLTGAAAQAEIAAYRSHPQYLACFASPTAFAGFTGLRANRAVYVAADGLYEAALFSCRVQDIAPCVRYAESGGAVTLTVSAPAGDPRMTGGP